MSYWFISFVADPVRFGNSFLTTNSPFFNLEQSTNMLCEQLKLDKNKLVIINFVKLSRLEFEAMKATQ
jgi:hypothetical protein